MYKNLSVFLENVKSTEKVVEYDFKNESPCTCKPIKDEIDPINNFRKYKKCTQCRFDCDNSNGTCTLTNDIYLELWGCSYDNRYKLSDSLKDILGDIWPRFSADTMNSFQTTYTIAQKLYDSGEQLNNEWLVGFAKYTHTLGNFTLIPFSVGQFARFNPARNGKFKDYFDLSLKFIQENSTPDAFKRYIDTFFLNDYVGSNYEVLPLFERHKEFLSQDIMNITNTNVLLPQNSTELNEYLQNVITKIKSRGEIIARKLFKRKSLCVSSVNEYIN